MKISKLLAVSCVCVGLVSCSSINAVHPTNTATQNMTKETPLLPKCKKKKDPMEVSFYTHGANPEAPYMVVGEMSVSKFNTGGVKRQDAVIHDAMRSEAALMGGDAVIDIKQGNKTVSGTVISYQSKIMV